MAGSHMKIDKDSFVPLYFQLKSILLEQIEKMEPDEMIPPESSLCAEYNVSRTTVRQAIAELVNEKYLYTVRGKGTFVAEQKIDLEYMNKIESFDEQVRQSGREPSTIVLEQKVISADNEIASHLNIPVGQEVLKLKRLRFADQDPIALAISYLPLPLCEELVEMNLSKVSLYGVLDQDKDTEVRHVKRVIRASLANEEEVRLLQLKKEEEKALLCFLNVGYTAAEVPIEYCISKYRVDMNNFSVDLFR